MNRGNWTIIVIFAMALLMAAFAWWHTYDRSRRVKAFWGPTSALLIQEAPRVELLQLGPLDAEAAEDAESAESMLDWGPQARKVLRRTDMSQARGLIHARHWLVEDVHFYWDEADPSDATSSANPQWQFALRFSDQEHQATLAFDVPTHRVRMLETGREIRTGEMVERLAEFLAPYLQTPVKTSH